MEKVVVIKDKKKRKVGKHSMWTVPEVEQVIAAIEQDDKKLLRPLLSTHSKSAIIGMKWRISSPQVLAKYPLHQSIVPTVKAFHARKGVYLN